MRGFVDGSSFSRWRILLGMVAILLVRDSLAADCNLNGVDDADEVARGEAEDCNGNAIPDACESAPLEFRPRGEAVELPAISRAAIVLDVDGDGLNDVVFGLRASNLVSNFAVIRNLGGGELATPRLYSAGRLLASLALGDLDGDGDPDAVTANSSRLHVLENAGDGTYLDATEVTVPSSTRSVVLGDLDGDGGSEIIVATTQNGMVSVLRRQIDGSYESTEHAVGAGPGEMATGDLDADGDLDLAVALVGGVGVAMLYNDGSGVLAGGNVVETTGAPSGLRLGDMDQDGDEDIVTVREDGIVVLENRGGEGFLESTPVLVAVAGFALGDLDGDGQLDVVAADSGAGRVLALRNFEGVALLPPETLSAVWKAERLDVGDLDGDGDIDLAVAAPNPDRALVLWNREPGGLKLTPEEFRVGQRPHGGVLGDFDGDGVVDLASANGHQRTLSILRGDGNLGFEVPLVFEINEVVPSGQLFSPSAADFDLDGDLDLLFADRDVLSLVVSFNRGDGYFLEDVAYPVGTGAELAHNADVNADGYADLLSSNAGGNTFLVFLNQKDGTFVESQRLELGAGPSVVADLDYDLDGDVDLVVANRGSSEVSVLLNDGVGTFVETARIPVGPVLGAVVTGSFDADEFLDLAAVGSGSITVFFGEATGSFRRVDAFVASIPATYVAVADLDGDDLDDLVATSVQTDLGVVLRSRGDGTFTGPEPFDFGPEVRFLVTGDLDGDGDADVVSGNRGRQTATVLFNHQASVVEEALFLYRICTPADYQRFARFQRTKSAERLLTFVAPAREEETLRSPAYVNTARFSNARDFLLEAFPERFPDLTETAYEALVLLRAERQYFVGSIVLLRLDDGTAAYGLRLDVDRSDSAEAPTRAEVEQVLASVSEDFELGPLGYVPVGTAETDAAMAWTDFAFPLYLGIESAPPVEPPVGGTPTFLLEIPPATEMCATFFLAGADRGPREEFELKSRVRFRAGLLELPTTEERFSGDFIEEVLLGPAAEAAIATSPGTFRVVTLPAGDATNYRFSFEQEFVLSSGQQLVVQLVAPIVFQARGDAPIGEGKVLGEAFFVASPGSEAFQATVDGEPLVRYGSCSYRSLPLWEVRALLADGTALRFEERWEPSASVNETSPAQLTRAEVVFGGAPRSLVATDYFELVYSAFRHNEAAHYWASFPEPTPLAEGMPPVRVVELVAPSEILGTPASARYLDSELNPVAAPDVVSFVKRRLIADPVARFIRGDVVVDGTLDIADAIAVLGYLFQRQEIACGKAADVDDDGRVNILDALRLVAALVSGGGPPPPPFPACGTDPTGDGVACDTPALCGS